MLFGFDRIFVSTIAKARGEGKYAYLKGLLYDYALLALSLALLFFCGVYLLRNYLVEYYDLDII